jgi:hypothetical protein
MSEDLPHHSAAAAPEHVASPADTDAARVALRYGPRGALVIAATTLIMLLAGWLAFYLLLFLPRGGIR